jgi:hypothetical protein
MKRFTERSLEIKLVQVPISVEKCYQVT